MRQKGKIADETGKRVKRVSSARAPKLQNMTNETFLSRASSALQSSAVTFLLLPLHYE